VFGQVHFPRRMGYPSRLSPSRWLLWSIPHPVLVYVLAVDIAAAVAITLATFLARVTAADLIAFALLAASSAVHIEACRHIERLREVAAEGVPYVNLKSLWLFAGAIVLPLPLALALVVTTYVHSWLRLRRVPPHRVAFSAASIVLAVATVAVILIAISPVGYPGFPSGPLGLLAGVCAAVAYWFVNYALVVGAIILSNPAAPGGKALGRLADQGIVAGALGLGFAVAALIVYQPWAVSVLLLTVLGLHRALLLGQFQAAANTDSKTGLLEATFWHTIAAAEVARAQRTGAPLGLLMIDLDDFKAVNDTYGHLHGDRVLKAVAQGIKQQVREYDLVGRFGGEEFVVLLPGIDAVEIANAAERIRHEIERLRVGLGDDGEFPPHQLTCSIGGAVYPETATDLDQLLLTADTATYTAKNQGRNRVCMAPSAPANKAHPAFPAPRTPRQALPPTVQSRRGRPGRPPS
jgi:diguanylate cyclase (GGDEF)-like protein